ncbi:hypothetical protein GPL21_01695 [Bradyrhizobium pachyrhizi]|uniref:Uncharacterized protein n=1 Tax=Bradyrhizobium pachyrhizi TaxID=280333 RepID=A0A844S9R8_9BRAD|nr:hypothetical protein [Bradyrhizobium pachyrhizi]
MEAVVAEAAMMEEARTAESGAGKPRADRRCTDEAGTTNVPAGEMSATAHGGERRSTTTHPAAETTAMHAAAKAATMHAATHGTYGTTNATAVAATEATAAAMSAATTAASGEGSGCKRNADGERRCRETLKKPVLHETLPDWDRGKFVSPHASMIRRRKPMPDFN